VKITLAELLTSSPSRAHFPASELPEVAFLGRSNVGKSSLLNALAQRKQLARTSSTPGKTRLIHFFRLLAGRCEFVLVDLPGYGWAKVSHKERASWRNLVESYLGARPQLRVAILLQDLRRDFGEDEDLLLAWLAERGVPACVALTKADKLKPMRRQQRVAELRSQIPLPPEQVIVTSAETRTGLDDLWRAIYARL
jgi:GTP-binding protein